jgi:hypothetical protein
MRVPALEGLGKTDFHRKSVWISNLYADEDEESTPGLEVVPCLSRYSDNKVVAQVVNRSEHPIQYEEGFPLARIEISNEHDQHVDLTDIRETEMKFKKIPRVDSSCPNLLQEIKQQRKKKKKKLKPEEPVKSEEETGAEKPTEKPPRQNFQVHIQFADKYGMTHTNENLVTCFTTHGKTEPLEKMQSGIVIRKHFEGKIRDVSIEDQKVLYTLFLIPDDEGSYSSITEQDILEARKFIKINFEGFGMESPDFFMIDPSKHGPFKQNLEAFPVCIHALCSG